MSEASGNSLESNTSKDLLELKKNISELDKTEQLEILKILQRHQDHVTENKNGIFINLCNISTTAIQEVSTFVRYSIENRNRLSNLERLSEALLKESMLKRQYEGYECSDANSKETETDEPSDTTPLNDSSLHSRLTDELPLDDAEGELECLAPLQQQAEVEEVNIVEGIEDPEELEELEEIEDIKPPLPLRKNKYTGRSARILKRCKEINRTHQSEHTYYLRTSYPKEDEEDEEDDIVGMGENIISQHVTELVEEHPPF